MLLVTTGISSGAGQMRTSRVQMSGGQIDTYRVNITPKSAGYFKTNYGNSRFFDHICSGAEMLICEW